MTVSKYTNHPPPYFQTTSQQAASLAKHTIYTHPQRSNPDTKQANRNQGDVARLPIGPATRDKDSRAIANPLAIIQTQTP